MKTTGVSGIPKFGLLDFLGHPSGGSKTVNSVFGARSALLLRNSSLGHSVYCILILVRGGLSNCITQVQFRC